MMVPIETLLALTVVFFLREVYVRSRPTDHDSGYRQAIKDIVRQWNKLSYAEKYTATEFLGRLKKYIESKQDGM